jgi:hypothetical protein
VRKVDVNKLVCVRACNHAMVEDYQAKYILARVFHLLEERLPGQFHFSLGIFLVVDTRSRVV